MRLTVPPLEISEEDGFSKEDIFKREKFGERLSNLIRNTEENMVIALHAPWGEGKSTFIKMWRGYLKNKNNGIHTIYFDAFENDHQSSPFLALAGEIYNLIGEDTEKSNFKDKAVGALKTTGRIALRLGIKALSSGILDGTTLENGIKNDAAKDISETVDGYVANRLKAAAADKKNVEDFKEYLEELPKKLNGKSIVFIIDELDRCKPPFALEIVEVIKHFFSVPNITFVLALNRTQLEASVRNVYGTDAVDASKYLQKFINLWISLPKFQKGDAHEAKVYLSYCIERMGMKRNQDDHVWIDMFEELVVHYNLSLREIERSLTNFAFVRSGLNPYANYALHWILVYLSIIKVKYANEYARLSAGSIKYTDLVQLTQLDGLKKDWNFSEMAESHGLKWILRYSLSTDDEIRTLLAKGNPYMGTDMLVVRGATKTISQWLDSLHQ